MLLLKVLFYIIILNSVDAEEEALPTHVADIIFYNMCVCVILSGFGLWIFWSLNIL
jgi:hypothetical protein